MDLLEGLQASKMSFSSHTGSESPLHSQFGGSSPHLPGGGDGGALSAQAAWRLLLDTRLPFLSAELQAAADFLLLWSPSASNSSESASSVKGQLDCHVAHG